MGHFGTCYFLRMTYDQLLIADVDYMMTKVIEVYDKAGLKVNLTKAKYMVINGEATDLQVNEKVVIKAYEEYKYLEQRLKFEAVEKDYLCNYFSTMNKIQKKEMKKLYYKYLN